MGHKNIVLSVVKLEIYSRQLLERSFGIACFGIAFTECSNLFTGDFSASVKEVYRMSGR